MTAAQWVLATGNTGKLAEFRRRLKPVLLAQNTTIEPQSAWSVPEAVEDGVSFVENALIKARNAAAHTGLPALADDSGLQVDALNGAPGVYSARFAGPAASDQDNIDKLLAALDGVTDRGASFHCSLVWVRHAEDPTPIVAQGDWRGEILTEARGSGGFGYDPVFLVPDMGCSSAELDPDTKNRLSHRGRAIDVLLERFAMPQ